jgi:putative Mg2+ transporter-C (MgtC) family protein
VNAEWADIARLLAAVLGGAIIGFERELHDKPAGLRTNILICLGAALFTLLSIRLGEDEATIDKTRIAAQIVTGVGFLGAGAIIQFRGNVLGLTTAATIWAVASVGMAFGAGHYFLGTVVTLIATGVLLGLSATEKSIARWRTTAHLEIHMQAAPEVAEAVHQLVSGDGLHCRSWSVEKADSEFVALVTLVGPEQRISHVQAALIATASVRSLRRL